MKRLKVTSEEQANLIRTSLDELLGYDDGNGTKTATGPAYPDADGNLYLTVRENWPDMLIEAEKMPDGCEMVEWDNFVAPVVEDEMV
jgi:hypothetical protein